MREKATNGLRVQIYTDDGKCFAQKQWKMLVDLFCKTLTGFIKINWLQSSRQILYAVGVQAEWTPVHLQCCA